MTTPMDVPAALAAGVPAPILTAVARYVHDRTLPPLFTRCVIANDLFNAIAVAPSGMTMQELRATTLLVFNFVPGRARGSDIAVAAWVNGNTKAPDWPTAKGQTP